MRLSYTDSGSFTSSIGSPRIVFVAGSSVAPSLGNTPGFRKAPQTRSWWQELGLTAARYARVSSLASSS